MENQKNASQQQNIDIQIPITNNAAPTLFMLVIIFFFFNFFTISCDGEEVGSVTGMNLITGTEFKHYSLSSDKTKRERVPNSPWAIIAFAAAIVGLGAPFLVRDHQVSLANEKKENLISLGASVIGFSSLFILPFVIESEFKDKAGGRFEVNFQFGYWAALLTMAIAFFICCFRLENINKNIATTTSSSPPTKINEENPTPSISKDSIQPTENLDIEE